MKKYMLAFLITIPIILFVWNMGESAEEPNITYNGTVEESAINQVGILQGTGGIMSEEVGDSWSGSQRSVDTYGIESTVEWMREINNEVLLTQKIKEHLQNNDFRGYTFQESEKALCYYMGINNDFSNMYVFSICKEALNGDIVHERDIYIAKETGHLYAKDDGTLVELSMDVPKGMQLPDVTRNSAWNREPELVCSEDGTSFHYAYGENGEKVLDQMFNFAKREEVSGNWGVMYYGECTYFNRRYHEVHLVEEHDTHIITLKRYYIDALNGNVYEEPYESFVGEGSDIALHFVGKIEIGEEEIVETGDGEESDAADMSKAVVEEAHDQGILYEHTLLGKMWFHYSAEEIPYVDEETFELIRQAYDEVDYSAEFEKGNLEVYEEYKQKFWGLMQNGVPFLDKETGKELYIKDWMELHGLIVPEDFKNPYTYRYYFFDMNGDGAPELCVENVIGLVFAYDPDTDQCILWTWLNGKDIVGTRTVVWNPDYDTDIYEFFRLDSCGNVELDTLFWAEHEDLYHDDINMVMFPNYADREKRWEITDEMKKQGVFEESSGQWFFKTTDEQFDELAKPYMEARKLTRERSREERYTYDELFGEYETG